ncbi:MAG: zinc ribbon domain-containing protein [Anaerorhabdus sp.]|uniref:zinc ribbon domain-containing protein n=1 Tax=Anaerorhabdus sp. TaxID=1872524 RepID=UPI002FC6A245
MKICQSCGMPLNEDLFGKNSDGTNNEDYCLYCYEDGRFTVDCTMEEMIDFCLPHMEGMNEEEARKMLNEMLPQLKRWQKA